MLGRYSFSVLIRVILTRLLPYTLLGSVWGATLMDLASHLASPGTVRTVPAVYHGTVHGNLFPKHIVKLHVLNFCIAYFFGSYP
jgi:hypothetical protein